MISHNALNCDNYLVNSSLSKSISSGAVIPLVWRGKHSHIHKDVQTRNNFMTNRVKRFIYSFPTPFQLTGMNEICAAGDYEITTEDESIGDFIVPAFRRISTTIYIPPPVGRPGIGQIVEINPQELMVPVLKP
jgi:hypothetical protein